MPQPFAQTVSSLLTARETALEGIRHLGEV